MLLTTPLLLKISAIEHKALAETLRACNRAAQAAAEWMLANKCRNQFEAHASLYLSLKEEFGLGAQAAVRALGKATDTVKRLKADTTSIGIREDGAFPFEHKQMFRLIGEKLSLWSTSGRLKGIAFACEPTKLPLVLTGKHRQSDLRLDRKGRLWLDLVVETEDSPEQTPLGFLGVDLGLTNLAVTSTGEVFGGGDIERIRRKSNKVRRSLQKRGTHKACRALWRIGGRQARWQKQESHRVAKRLVEAAKAQSLGIALEDLTGLRATKGKRTASRETRARLGNWPFALIRAFVAYKAKQAGVKVMLVNPAFTSQACSCCGHTAEANRVSRDAFVCGACGHESCADLNAAINISKAALAAFSSPGESQAGGVRNRPEGPSALRQSDGQSRWLKSAVVYSPGQLRTRRRYQWAPHRTLG